MILIITSILFFFAVPIFGQMTVDGPIPNMPMDYIIEDNDTLYITSLESISVTAPRYFESSEDYRRYLLYRRYAAKVYPYAVRAIEIYNSVEDDTKDLSERKRKKHIRQMHKELKEEFLDPLKKLTKTQGKILVKMIERELDIAMFELLKEMRGSLTASYWNTFSRLYGYKLKDKYFKGEDVILDSVLEDFDISL